MRWFGKPRERADIFLLAKINDRIQVEAGGRSYLSRIEDIGEGELHIAAPVERGGTVMVRPGQAIRVNLFEGMGIKQFSGQVDRIDTSRIALAVVTGLKYWGSVQRREHVRISQRLPVRFRLEDGPDGEAPWFEGATQDMSGGGIQIVAETRGIDAIVKGDLLEIELYLPEQSPAKAVGQIVRASSPNPLAASHVRFGLQFVEISPGERSRIVRYVLRKQAEILSSRREFTACSRTVPVQYRSISEGASSELRTAHTTEIGLSGLKMAVPKGNPIAVGEKLHLYLAIPDMQTVSAEAEVSWLEEGAGASGSHAGLKLTSIDRQSQQTISKFLDEENGGAKAA